MKDKEKSELKLSYSETTGKITLQTYDDGFFNCEVDMTSAIMELAVEKLFNDVKCEPNGGKVILTRKKMLEVI